MTKLVIAEPFPPALAEALRKMLPASIEVDMVASLSEADFAKAAADADVLVCARRRIDAPTLQWAPKVSFIQQLGIGYDNLDLRAITAAGVTAAYNPGFNTITVAEHTIMLMLVLLRRFTTAEQVTRAGRFPTMEFIQENQAHLAELGDVAIGLVGLGSIGHAVAERLAAFGSVVLYTARHRNEEAEARLGLRYMPLQDLLSSCNLVSLHVPLTPDTLHLMGEAEFALMQPGALLVNTSRGQVVDEAALRRAIENGRLSGAAIDVLEDEMGGVNCFADLPQVLVTPHVAGSSRTSLPRMLEMAAANVVRFLQGEPLQNLVPPAG
jgi:phosphoglycerate dehydrogenase-like enzyme